MQVDVNEQPSKQRSQIRANGGSLPNGNCPNIALHKKSLQELQKNEECEFKLMNSMRNMTLQSLSTVTRSQM
jgi:hypothetical protein